MLSLNATIFFETLLCRKYIGLQSMYLRHDNVRYLLVFDLN